MGVVVPLPMLATAGRPPEDSDLWATEMKWDGMRAVTLVDNGESRLYSRNGREATSLGDSRRDSTL